VKSHITHLFEKLGVSNRVQIAITAHRAGVVDGAGAGVRGR